MSKLIEKQLPWIGLDIGGANIKAAHENGDATAKRSSTWHGRHGAGLSICLAAEIRRRGFGHSRM